MTAAPRPERTVAPPRHDRILAVAAHLDDIKSWCAGTLAICVDAGADVRLMRLIGLELEEKSDGWEPRDVYRPGEGMVKAAVDSGNQP